MPLLNLRCSLIFSALLTVPVASFAAAQASPQATPAQARAQAATVLGDSLQQLNVNLDRLGRTLSEVTVSRWKAPGDVRQTTQSDVESMQRDLSNTLPGLISAAQANQAQMAPAFSVYRNVDALYDVLLRVSETAQLAGASTDGRALEEQRSALESSRTQLGAALLQSAQAQDAELTQLRTAGSSPATAKPAAKTVVDDGPAAPRPAKRSRKPAPPPQ